MTLRIAFSGASGTGKSTLAEHVALKYCLPVNPIGSRSVSKAMGFDSPYDVDKAGRRAEFQRRLVVEKVAWENEHEAFVTDRTTLDNLAYTMLHDVHSIDDRLVRDICAGLSRYTHVVYCPVDAFCNVAGDPNRVADMTYHRLYDVVIEGLLRRYLLPCVRKVDLPNLVGFRTIPFSEAEARRGWLDGFLGAVSYRP